MITIRKGTPADVEPALLLIKELAAFEKAPEQVINTVEQMLIDGYGEKPIFDLQKPSYVTANNYNGRC